LLGDETLRVLDIGARGDLAPRFAPMAGRVAVVGFEPNLAECDRLNEALRGSPWREARVLPYAVGRTAVDRPFYLTEAPELSSLLEPLPAAGSRPGWRVRTMERVDTIALDDLAAAGELPQPVDFLKIDTQGSELEILRSGEAAVLDDVLGIAVEVEFRELYRGQPLFGDVEQYLRGRGFDLLLLETAHLRTDWPLARKRADYADALFLRGPAWMAAQSPTEGARRRLLALYALYGLYVEAHALAAGTDPALAEVIAADYRATGWGARRRLRLIVEALRCASRPTPANRHRLARLARAINTADGRGWLIEPP
jgi:FkbM family methyltransferase